MPLSDDYFVSNIEKVDSVTLLRKDKVMTGISWSVKFQRSLDTWPCLNDLGATAAQVRKPSKLLDARWNFPQKQILLHCFRTVCDVAHATEIARGP